MYVNVFGPANTLGFGIHCQNMIKAFQEINQEVTFNLIGQPQIDPWFKESNTRAHNNSQFYFSAKNPSIFIFHEHESNRYSGKPAFTYSIFETTKINPLCKQMLNNGPSDYVLVTTELHKSILLDNGIKTPIKVLHEGVDPKLFNTNNISKFIDTKKFTFITAGKNEKRKNTTKIIQSYIDTCQYKESALICLTQNPFINGENTFTDIILGTYGYELVQTTNEYAKFSNTISDIYFIKYGLPMKSMSSIYHSAHVGIQCSSGEAWDLPLIEMQACGLPCIATHNLGHIYLDVNSKELGIYPTKTEKAIDNMWFKGQSGDWDIIEIDDIRDRIELVIKNQEKYRHKLVDNSNYIINNFSWQKAAESFLTLI